MFIRTSRALLFLGLSLLSGFTSIKAAELYSIVISEESDPPNISAPIILAAGDLFEMEYVSHADSILRVIKNGQEVLTNSTSTGAAGIPHYPSVPKIIGPAEIKIEGNSRMLVTYKIARAFAPVTAVPSTAVVIPENVTGDFQVILEASADLQTWTPVSPGTFSSTHPQRFFRTRIFKTP